MIRNVSNGLAFVSCVECLSNMRKATACMFPLFVLLEAYLIYRLTDDAVKS